MIVLSVLQEGEKQREPSKTDQRRMELIIPSRIVLKWLYKLKET